MSESACSLPRAGVSLDDRLLRNLTTHGVPTLNSLQASALKLARKFQNVVITAPPCSGKTLSYIVPIINHELERRCREDTHEAAIRAVILLPTRELAQQVETVLQAICKGIPHMKSALLVGGVPGPSQLYRLRSDGVCFAIGTPGRFVDILSEHPDDLKLEAAHSFVLDECDELLRGSMSRQVSLIQSQLGNGYKLFAVSATPCLQTSKFIQRRMKGGDEMIAVASQSLDGRVTEKILLPSEVGPSLTETDDSEPCRVSATENVIWCPDNRDKKRRLLALLADNRKFKPPVVVFVSDIIGTTMLADTIHKSTKLNCSHFNSELTQTARSETLARFIAGGVDVMVSTCLAARGLELQAQVVVYDFPPTIQDYAHMLGRQRSDCESYAFVTPEDRHKIRNIVDHLRSREQFVSQELLILASRDDSRRILPVSSASLPTQTLKGTKRRR